MTPTVAMIQRHVAAEYGVSVDDLRGGRRAIAIVRPRQVAMALASQLTTCSFPTIGRKFGGRDHTTVLHARDTIAHRCQQDPVFAAELDRMRRAILAAATGEDVGEAAGELATALAAAFSRALFELVREDPLRALAAMQPLVRQLGVKP